MNKQGNTHSELLDKFAEIASQKTEKPSDLFNIEDVLQQPQQPTLRDIFAEVKENTGKNIRKTAQFDSLGEPPLGEGLQDGEGPHGFGGRDSLETDPVEPMGDAGDPEQAKQALIDGLIALCGSPEAACECIMSNGGIEEEVAMEDELGPAEPDLGPGDDLGTDEMPAPMPIPA